MKNVTYINAGAGSGKTHTLTEKLTELIKEHKVHPEQVILTTFTVKAANEFKEKAKAALFKEGMYNEAASLDHALIGTIHSVCQRMIGKYWFNLGLSPDMGVMAQDDTAFYISQSLSDLATDEELKMLHRFALEFDVRGTENGKVKSAIDYDFWQKELKSIIDYATNYEIDDFKASAEVSLKYIRQFTDPNNTSVYSYSELKDVVDEHEVFLKGYRQSAANDERINNLAEARKGLYNPTIKTLKQIAGTIGTPQNYGPLADKFKMYMENIWTSKIVYDKQEEYIRLLFDLAQRWKENFAQFKREKNLLDYNDMEKYMLQLMNDKSVAAEISQSYRYLFVDEFQDSSPIQVKIFDALSDLMEHSYWVGDYKQAIFGFRGSDTDLTKSVVDRISTKSNGCNTQTLDTSWRSLPDIVEVNNSVFCETFKKVLDYDKIHLKQHRTNEDGEVSLRYFCCREGAGVAEHVLRLLDQGAKPNEIAVLALTNESLKSLATDLNSLSVPCSREDASIVDSPVYQLVVSLLRIVSSRDALAKATVAFLTEKDYNVKNIIEEKLLIDADPDRKTDEYLTSIPLVRQLLAIRPQLLNMSVASLVETMIICLDLFDQAKNIEQPATASICLQTFINTAKDYEQHCMQMNLPSTIEGFIAYVDERKPVGVGDPEGVQLYTYHSSKGLQWKYVILMSLNTDIADLGKSVKREIYGVHVVHNEAPSADNPYPDVFIRLTPWIYGAARNVPRAISDQIVGSEEFKAAYEAMIAENNRILYVGMTRAKDVMIMAIEPEKRGTKFLQWPISVGVHTVVKNIPPAGGWDIFGNGHKFTDFTLTEAEVSKLQQYSRPDKTEGMLLNISEPRFESLPPRYLAPSKIAGIGKAIHVKDFGLRIKFDGKASDMAAVGNCIHQIYAGIENGPESALEMEELAAAYGLAGLFTDMTEITKAWENLKEFLTETYGSPVNVYHERPFRLEKDGQTIVGSIDLVWETENGDILLDFKTCPLGMKAVMDPESEYYAGRYAGQLNAYEDALTAAGERVFKRLIYYPVSGNLVEVERL